VAYHSANVLCDPRDGYMRRGPFATARDAARVLHTPWRRRRTAPRLRSLAGWLRHAARWIADAAWHSASDHDRCLLDSSFPGVPTPSGERGGGGGIMKRGPRIG